MGTTARYAADVAHEIAVDGPARVFLSLKRLPDVLTRSVRYSGFHDCGCSSVMTDIEGATSCPTPFCRHLANPDRYRRRRAA